MHRTIRVKFLVGLVIAILLVSAGLVWLYRRQDEQLSQTLLEQAETAQAAGRTEEAARGFQRYLRVRPGDQDARAAFAVMLDEQARSAEAKGQALQELAEVLAQQPERHDIRKRLARAAIETRQYTAALKHLEILVKLNPDDDEVAVMLAQCALETHEYIEAGKWLEKVVMHDPHRIESYSQLAWVQNKLGNPKRQEEVLDALVEANPTSGKAYLARARYHHLAKSLEQAAVDIARAQELAPEDFDVLTVAAEIAFDQGKFDQTREILKKCFAVKPQQTAPYLLRARLERQAGHIAEAIACLQQGVAALPEANRDALRFPLADLLIQDRRLAEARTTLQQLRNGKAASLPVDFFEARLLIQESDWPKAAVAIERLTGLRTEADIALASQLRDVAEEPKEYRHHLALGLNLWKTKKASAEVETCLNRAMSLSDWAPEALTAYVQYLVDVKQKDKAEALVEQARQKPSLAAAALPLAYCYELLGRADRAGQIYDAVLATRAASPAMLRAGAEFHLHHGHFTQATAHLRRLLDPKTRAAASDEQWARRTLAIGLAISRDYPAFQEALTLLDGNFGNGSEDRRARAIVLAQQPMHRAKAIALLETLREDGTISTGDLFILVQLHDANRDWTKARERLSALLTAPAGKTPTILAYATQAELQHGSVDRAKSHLAELAKLEANSFGTLVLEARLARAMGDRPGATEIVRKLAGREGADLGLLAALLEEFEQIEAADAMFRAYVNAGTEPSALLARARFLGRQRRLAEALDLCEQAWKTCSPAEVAAVAVALLRTEQASSEQRVRVEKWLQTALARTPGAASLLLTQADLHEMQGRSADAARCYRQVLTGDAGNVLAMNNLAWLLARQEGRVAEALDLINKAVKLHGPSPHLLDTRAIVHMAAGTSDAAVRDLELATAIEPSAVRYFHLAQAYQLGRQRRNAEQALLKARAANLTVQQLHVSERAAYRQLLEELERK